VRHKDKLRVTPPTFKPADYLARYYAFPINP
jgi:hypothetical protein